MSKTFHLTTLFVAFFANSLFAQHKVVSPGAFADLEAPNAGDVSGFSSYRFQQVYSASDFAHLGDGPFTITRIDWRPGSEMIETIDYPSERFIMKFDSTKVDPALDGPATVNSNPVISSWRFSKVVTRKDRELTCLMCRNRIHFG